MSEAQFGAGLLGAFLAIIGTCALAFIIGYARTSRRVRYQRNWR